MKKNIVIAVFLLVVTLFGTKAFVALFAYQTMESLKQTLQKDVSLTYSWISSSYDGAIVFHDLVVTPYRLKRTFYIEQAELQYDGYLGLLFGLPDLKDGHWRGLQRIIFEPVRIPFEGRNPEQLLALEYGDKFAVPFGVYACGDRSRMTHKDHRAMGLNEVEASLDIKLDNSPDSEELGLSVMLDLNALGKIQLESRWATASMSSHFSKLQLEHLVLKSLSLTHIENGYFRRLSNYCSALTGTGREHFSAESARQWRTTLSETGIDVGEGLESLYRDYLLQGGQANLSLKLADPFSTRDFESILDQDLIPRFGIKAALNGEPVAKLKLRLNGDHFRPPEPVIELTDNVKRGQDLLEAGTLSRFIPLSESELDLHLGRQVRLKLKDGKQFQGELVSINEQKLEIAQLIGGGKVAYFLSRDKIEQIELRR